MILECLLSVSLLCTPVESDLDGGLSAPDKEHAHHRADWDLLAECESGGDWSINTGNGFYGGLQFTLQSWQWVGGEGYPHEATKEEQIRRAVELQERQGWGAWPACTKELGWTNGKVIAQAASDDSEYSSTPEVSLIPLIAWR